MTSLDDLIAATLLNIEKYKKHIKKSEEILAEARRRKWWLEHPEVAYFTARTSWETNYGHSEWESELSFYVDSVIGVDGSKLDFYNRGWFDHYPALESEVRDDNAFVTYRNPFLCT
jgi:hypothetical protein